MWHEEHEKKSTESASSSREGLKSEEGMTGEEGRGTKRKEGDEEYGKVEKLMEKSKPNTEISLMRAAAMRNTNMDEFQIEEASVREKISKIILEKPVTGVQVQRKKSYKVVPHLAIPIFWLIQCRLKQHRTSFVE